MDGNPGIFFRTVCRKDSSPKYVLARGYSTSGSLQRSLEFCAEFRVAICYAASRETSVSD
jgi:hypothetical protein